MKILQFSNRYLFVLIMGIMALSYTSCVEEAMTDKSDKVTELTTAELNKKLNAHEAFTGTIDIINENVKVNEEGQLQLTEYSAEQLAKIDALSKKLVQDIPELASLTEAQNEELSVLNEDLFKQGVSTPEAADRGWCNCNQSWNCSCIDQCLCWYDNFMDQGYMNYLNQYATCTTNCAQLTQDWNELVLTFQNSLYVCWSTCY